MAACQEQASESLTALKSASPHPEVRHANLTAFGSTTGMFEVDSYVHSTRSSASPPTVRFSKRYLFDCALRL